MIIYNVTIKVQLGAAVEWLEWMTSEHIADVVGTGCFTRCRLCRLLEQDESEGLTFVAQYEAPGIAEYQEYLDRYAPAMREKGFARFGDRFFAFRTVMEVIG